MAYKQSGCAKSDMVSRYFYVIGVIVIQWILRPEEINDQAIEQNGVRYMYGYIDGMVSMDTMAMCLIVHK
ncbi:MAG: hypothetical protein HQL04_00395 [Nitrospirae bacterium]|nr:hypothetical protein [Nitrospirota bacterium]